MAASHYELLGVAPGASAEEVRRAYRAQARRFHPDLQPAGNAPALAAAQRQMAVLAEAYAVLANPEARQAYDRSIGRRPWSEGTGTGDGDGDGLDGSAPEGRPGAATHGHPSEGEDERFDRLGLDDDDAHCQNKPADLLMIIPVALAALTVVTFALGVMVQSHMLWAVAVAGALVSAVAFMAAPLVSMLRARTSAPAPVPASGPAPASAPDPAPAPAAAEDQP